ncbi:MAG TPA: hypothetical protein DCL44_12330 [Elusimicrobia bacterium]|nr:hypothetical protein [Elusimicrobiota bacterium]
MADFLRAPFRVYGRGLERIPIIGDGEDRSSRTAMRAGAFRSRRKTPAVFPKTRSRPSEGHSP